LKVALDLVPGGREPGPGMEMYDSEEVPREESVGW